MWIYALVIFILSFIFMYGGQNLAKKDESSGESLSVIGGFLFILSLGLFYYYGFRNAFNFTLYTIWVFTLSILLALLLKPREIEGEIEESKLEKLKKYFVSFSKIRSISIFVFIIFVFFVGLIERNVLNIYFSIPSETLTSFYIAVSQVFGALLGIIGVFITFMIQRKKTDSDIREILIVGMKKVGIFLSLTLLLSLFAILLTYQEMIIEFQGLASIPVYFFFTTIIFTILSTLSLFQLFREVIIFGKKDTVQK